MAATDDGALRALVCIPTYDEAEHVRTVASRVRAAQPEVQLLIVDDEVDRVRRAHEHGLSIVEVPTVFVERELGAGKMSGGIVTEALWRVTVWGAQRRLRLLIRRLTGRPVPIA